jgi:hypothetical protein
MVVSCDMELVSGPSIEGMPRVRSDLGGDAEGPQQTEGSTRDGWIGDVEMHGDLSASLEVHASGGME